MIATVRLPSTLSSPDFASAALAFTAKGQFIIDDEPLPVTIAETLLDDCLKSLEFAELVFSDLTLRFALAERFAFAP